jgi:uncharacterized membrane protein YuzA (DUF378 family)
MNAIAKTALTLVIVGALNWLLVGLFHFDLVAAIFGNMTVLSRAVYVLVGIAGLYCLTLLFRPVATATPVRSDYRRAA